MAASVESKPMARWDWGAAPPRPAPHRARTRYRAGSRLRWRSCRIPLRVGEIRSVYRTRAPASEDWATCPSTQPGLRHRPGVGATTGPATSPFHVKHAPRPAWVWVRHTYRSRAPCQSPSVPNGRTTPALPLAIADDTRGPAEEGGEDDGAHPALREPQTPRAVSLRRSNRRNHGSPTSGGRTAAETRRWSANARRPPRRGEPTGHPDRARSPTEPSQARTGGGLPPLMARRPVAVGRLMVRSRSRRHFPHRGPGTAPSASPPG
jgi:hypothetical protein